MAAVDMTGKKRLNRPQKKALLSSVIPGSKEALVSNISLQW
jgi:hypothetical protein